MTSPPARPDARALSATATLSPPLSSPEHKRRGREGGRSTQQVRRRPWRRARIRHGRQGPLRPGAPSSAQAAPGDHGIGSISRSISTTTHRQGRAFPPLSRDLTAAAAMELVKSPVVDPADFSLTMAAVGPGDLDKEDKLIPIAIKEAEFSLTVAAVSPSDRDKEGKPILVALKEGHHVLLPEHTVVLKSILLLTKPDFSSTVVAVGPGDRDKEGKPILVALKERDRALLP